MNVRTALISSALLLAVLGWACEEQGPTSPSGLGTPGGAAWARPVSAWTPPGLSWGRSRGSAPPHPSCPDEEPPEDDVQRFDLTLTGGDIFSVPATITIKAGNGSNPGLLLENVTLDLSFFNGKLDCGGDTAQITGLQTGNLIILRGSKGKSGYPFISFGFTHNGIGHGAALRGLMDISPWPPTMPSTMTEGPVNNGNGFWNVDGGNDQDGCTGEGGAPVDQLAAERGIDFLATIVPCGDLDAGQNACTDLPG